MKKILNQPGLQGRTLCDRVARACNHNLGEGCLDFDHVSQLVKLVELSLHGYDICAAGIAQSSPLYMEKIIFHIVKKLSTLEVYSLCSRVAGLLYSRLATAQQGGEDYCVLVRNCFFVLWNGLSVGKTKKILNPRNKLHCQMQALSFLLLLDTESAIPSSSKVPTYTEDAITAFKSSCETMTKEDASFLIEEIQTLFNRCWTGGHSSEGDGSKQCADASSFYLLFEVALIWGIKIHSAVKAGEESGQAFTECARALRSVSADLGDREAHAVLEGCSLVVWAVESGHNKGFSGPALLALFSFLEEHQIRIMKGLKKVGVAADHDRAFVCWFRNLFLLIYELIFRTIGWFLVHNVYNVPTQLSRLFMLAVQTSRRSGHFERALDWVILWLKALGDKITTHMAEPVSLWVKTKTDAARNSEEDIRLRTLRDGFGPDVPDEQIMLSLLEEELRAYKEVAADMAQERYNTLCDLLDICHEQSSHTHLRAIYLCEMAQVVCFQDFSEQTDCTAVDFIHEALRLLEEETETPENADKLKDDKAHALLWLYICTLEKNLQEVSSLCQPLERALGGWSALLQHQALPSVRNPKQTCSSIALAAALFRLMGKVITQNVQKKKNHGLVCLFVFFFVFVFLFLSSIINGFLASSKKTIDYFCFIISPLSCFVIFQVDCGVPYLCEVLKEVNDQRQSKSWYLLRVQTFQTCSSYLSLDTNFSTQPTLDPCFYASGINTPDVALYESLKLLCSLLYTLVGGGLYGADSSSSSDVPGDNLVWKWLLLSEVLNSSMKLVAVRSSCGSINEARRQCLEALKLATKLQALSQCAELLVTKAELELMQGEREESKADLDKVRNLLDLCTDFSDQVKRTDVKIKPRKGRPVQKSKSPLPTVEDDLQDILSTRWITKEPIVKDQSSSPPLKAQPRCWLSCLAHEPDCLCPCCSEPCLGRATARWAATQADLVLQLDPNEASVSLKLQRTTLSRCKNLASKLKAKLTELFPAKGNSRSSLMQDVVGRVYLHMALSGLEPRLNKACGVWKVLEAGLAFVDSTPSPVLTPVRAGLLATKAIASLMLLAAKKGCTPEELFSNAWTWNLPKEDKELRSLAPSSTHKKSSGRTLDCFDFNTVVPTLACTPVPSMKGPTSVQKAPKTASKLQFHVYEELSPVQDKPQRVPAAPKRTKKSRFKVEFSDESDSEASTQAESKEKADVLKKRTTARRAGQNAKNVPGPPAEKVQPKRQVKGKRNTAVRRPTSSEDDEILVSTRRARTRRQLSQADAESMEEPDKMRSIEEETNDVLDMSIEQLRTSDTEADDNVASGKGNSLFCAHGNARHSHNNSVCKDVQSLLRSAWLSLQHFPSPTIYPNLCTLLALTMGQQDPNTTAMLHTQSLGVTVRHRTIRHLARCLKKQKKASSELTDEMDAMSLNEPSGSVSNTSTEQTLSQMDIFSFPTVDSSKFPQNHCQDFIQQIQGIPPGVTVCLMSVLGVKPGEMGNSIILSRLEKGSAPVTVHINTSKQQHPISWMMEEMDSILAEQQVMSGESLKAKWWQGRKSLDCRVGVGDKRMALLAVVLCLMQYLQKLPWESISLLKSCSVSRMPSLSINATFKFIGSQSILRLGVDTKKVFYVLDPDANLKNTQEQFKDWFASKPGWQGVCGVAPDSSQLVEAVATKDLYIYSGHGGGGRFLDSQAVLKRQMRAASLLIGCSSAALAVRGDQEGQGIILDYLIAGCPFILGNLWNVTDRDIDRFVTALLKSWFSAGSGASLLDYMGPARQVPLLRHIIGAAPVVYGLPVHLQ
uniref:separase n=1 Tax=Acanthochromis polyacanthus TaxID=80966 RepID=A0A3Q1GQH6_9TELE